MKNIYKPIIGYEDYGVSKEGEIISFKSGRILSQTLFNGYYVVYTFGSSITKTLPVHRAVALCWVKNPEPEKYTIVNHLDGNPTNNSISNLEWTDFSGNINHAFDNNLRTDNVTCKIRDCFTGEIIEFRSISYASKHMGFKRHIPHCMRKPTRFGDLIMGRWEFQYSDENVEWFYENRKGPITPARYMVKVKHNDGKVTEYFSSLELLKDFQLYKSPYGKGVPGLVKYANEIFTDKVFTFIDSFELKESRIENDIARAAMQNIWGIRNGQMVFFKSLRDVKRKIKIDPKTVKRCIKTKEKYNGWVFYNKCPTIE